MGSQSHERTLTPSGGTLIREPPRAPLGLGRRTTTLASVCEKWPQRLRCAVVRCGGALQRDRVDRRAGDRNRRRAAEHCVARLHIEVEALPIGDDTVRCTLYSERTLKTGRVLRTLHFEGTVLLGSAPVLPGLPRETFGDYALDADAIYRRFFHGPGFQVLTGVSAVGDRGLLASGQLNHKAIGAGLESAPLVLEAAFQAAGLHAMVSDGVLALPAGIESLYQKQKRLDTPHLAIKYRSTRKSTFWRT